MVTPMPKKTTTTLTLLAAVLTIAGLATATPLALVAGDGGGQAQGQAQGGYHADATGATDAAAKAHSNLHEKATSDARNANNAATQAKWQAYQQASSQELPQQPDCDCNEVFSELEQKGTMSASHADAVEKAANVDSEYVDAGADVSAAAQAKAWFSDLFKGTQDLYDEARGLVGLETHADEQAKAIAEETLTAEEEIRGEVVNAVAQEQELPRVNPSAQGQLGASHATEVASDAAGDASAGIP